jgi:hypothetical protein
MAVICNICNDNNPEDARYCISCGTLLSYEGRTQRLETERLDHAIEEELTAYINRIKQPSIVFDYLLQDMPLPSAMIWPHNKPLYVTREQLCWLLMKSEFANGYVTSSINPIMRYYGREIIIIDD